MGRKHKPQAAGPEAEAAVARDLRLFRQVVAGDRLAFAQLYREFYPRLYRFLLRMTRRVDLVEEVVNDVMLVVWEKSGSFGGRSRVSTWIYGIAYRKALKALDRRKRMPECLPAAIDVAHLAERHAPAGREEAAEWLDRGLEQLSAEHRFVIEAVYFLGLSCREVADIAGCPVNTVKTRMFYARKRLREILPPLSQPAASRRSSESPGTNRE